jgi:hypothetical protein
MIQRPSLREEGIALEGPVSRWCVIAIGGTFHAAPGIRVADEFGCAHGMRRPPSRLNRSHGSGHLSMGASSGDPPLHHAFHLEFEARCPPPLNAGWISASAIPLLDGDDPAIQRLLKRLRKSASDRAQEWVSHRRASCLRSAFFENRPPTRRIVLRWNVHFVFARFLSAV